MSTEVSKLDTDESNEPNFESKVSNIADKFKSYRMEAEATEKKLKETNFIIDQLKEELNISRDVEKNLRNQVMFTQGRLSNLQAALTKLIAMSEQKRLNEKTSLQIEKTVKDLDKIIKETQEKARIIFIRISNEMNLLKKNEELKFDLKGKEAECDMIKMEVKALQKEKDDLVTEYEKKLKSLKAELDTSKWKCKEIKTHCDKTLDIYKKQIEDHEQIIKEYERERKSLLEEFEPPKESNNVVTWADSTVSADTKERLDTQTEVNKIRKEMEGDGDANAFQCSSYSEIKNSKERKGKVSLSRQRRHKISKLKQTPLDFLIQSQNLSEDTQNSPQFPSKRRLFSTNCNHYIN